MTEFFHASRKTGHKGAAARLSAYITREGSFDRDRPNDLVATCTANLPDGVSGRDLWRAADRHLRRNGVAFRSWDVAFPRGLNRDQNTKLMKDLAVRLARGRPVQAAFHCPNAAIEGGAQPHGHFMIYDCVPDGIVRPLERMFGRYKPSDPAAGGCRKGGAASRADVRRELVEERKTCAEVINVHLERAGFSDRVDHRTNKERGLPAPKRAHLGPSGVRKLLKSERKN